MQGCRLKGGGLDGSGGRVRPRRGQADAARVGRRLRIDEEAGDVVGMEVVARREHDGGTQPPAKGAALVHSFVDVAVQCHQRLEPLDGLRDDIERRILQKPIALAGQPKRRPPGRKSVAPLPAGWPSSRHDRALA